MGTVIAFADHRHGQADVDFSALPGGEENRHDVVQVDFSAHECAGETLQAPSPASALLIGYVDLWLALFAPWLR